MSLSTEIDIGARHTVLDGDPALPAERAKHPPYFSAHMSIVVKRSPISATAELLLLL